MIRKPHARHTFASKGTGLITAAVCAITVLMLTGTLAHADDRLALKYPGQDITITKGPTTAITTLYSPAPPANLQGLIAKRFALLGLPAPTVRPLVPARLTQDMNAPGAALLLKSADTANALIDPLFDDAGMRFYLTENSVTTASVSVRIGGTGGQMLGTGPQVWMGDGPKPLLLTNGPLKKYYQIIYVPAGVDQSQLIRFTNLAGIQASEFREPLAAEINNFRRADVAVLTEISAFGNAGMAQLPAYFADLKIHALNVKSTLRDITPPLRAPKRVDVVTPQAVQPVPQGQVQGQTAALPSGIAPLDRSAPLSLPTPQPQVAPTVTPRTREEFDFSTLPANKCHVITPRDFTDRVAFVVGNGSYFPDIGWLENPPNDAVRIAATLSASDVKVYFVTEASRLVIEDCVEKLAVENRQGIDIAMLYYSGHGVQVDGDNFLVGINARRDGDITQHLVAFDRIAANLRRISRSTLFFLDACRDNPFGSDAQGLADLTDAAGGLTISADQNDYTVVYAAAPNAVASDGTGDTSPFTAAMLEAMATPGIPLQEVIVRVSGQVQRETNYQQQPYVSGNLTRLIYLAAPVSIEDLQTRADQAAAQAAEQARRDDPNAAIATLLSALPRNATDAELTTLFASADATLRRLLLTNVRAVPNLTGSYETAMGFKGHDNVLLLDTQDKLSLMRATDGRSLFDIRVQNPQRMFNPMPAGSADGRRIALSAVENRILVIDAQTGAMVQTLTLPKRTDNWSSDMSGLQLSPDGKHLLVDAANSLYYLFNLDTGAILSGFSELKLTDGVARRVHRAHLANDALCLMLSGPSTTANRKLAFFARIDIKTNAFRGVYGAEHPSDMFVDGFKCTDDGRYAISNIYDTPNQSGPITEVLDFDTGKVLIRDSSASTSTRQLGTYLHSDSSKILFNGANAASVFDLAEGQFRDTVFANDTLFNVGEYLWLISPPKGRVAEGFFRGLPDIAFHYNATPRTLIDLALARLPDTLRAQVQSERPELPD